MSRNVRRHQDRSKHGSRETIEVFHTRDQNHVTAVGAPYWRSSFATVRVEAVDVLSKLAASLVKEGSRPNVQAKYSNNMN